MESNRYSDYKAELEAMDREIGEIAKCIPNPCVSGTLPEESNYDGC